MPAKDYPSRVDHWIGALILLLVLGGVAGMIAGAAQWSTNTGAAATLLASGAFTVLLIVVLVWPVRYTITDTHIIIRFGLIRTRLELSAVTAIKPSRNLLSSPALSIDRLKVEHNRGGIGFILLSPVDKEAFMRDIASRVPTLTYENGEVRSA